MNEPVFVSVRSCLQLQSYLSVTLGIPHSSCPEGIAGKYNASSYNDLGELLGTFEERDTWRHTPASCGTAACAEAIRSYIDAVVNKTGFTV